MALPLSLVPAAELRKQLTVSYAPLGADEVVEVRLYRDDAEHLHVPRQFGLDYCRRFQLPFEDLTSLGDEVSFPELPTPRPEQIPVLDQLENTCGSYYDFLFRARTGFGKTVTTLMLAARLGRRTLVVVDQDNLMAQWREELEKRFGVCAGRIQGSVCDIKDYPVTIAMMQTLAQRRQESWVYDFFGTVLFDECHITGAPTFSEVLMDFSAAYRIGVSATPKRRDVLQKALTHHLGKVRVYVADAHAASSVYVRFNPSVYSWYANKASTTGRYLSEIAEDGARGLLVASSALLLYDSGRDVLVLSDRTDHLKNLYSLCHYMGVPVSDMGVYTGQTLSYRYVKDPLPPRRPEGWERGTEYTPVALQAIAKKTPKAVLKEIKERARIIFATYQMFSKGVDVPRLAAGVDATPRSQAEQVHGRILREKDKKLAPIWITIADDNSYRSLFQLASRIPDYERNNGEVYILSDDDEVTKCPGPQLIAALRRRVKELQSAQIETLSGGLHTIRSPVWPMTSVREPVNGTKRPRAPGPVSPSVSPRAAPSVRSRTPTRSVPIRSRPSP